MLNPHEISPYIQSKICEYRHLRTATNIYEKEWDLLILLDCATPEMMNEVQDDYDFIGEIKTLTSVGTCSNQWMKNTFVKSHDEEMESTVHVTANTSSETYLNEDQFQHLEEVWRDGWDEEIGTIPAREVTDRTIYYSRETTADRYIAHYMQPHLPFVTRPEIESNVVTEAGIKGDGKNLNELQESGYERKELWNASIENLRYVLDSVEILLSNMDAERAIISSDHGQAFGEEGIWSHPCETYIEPLTQVPWCPATGTDCGEYESDYEGETETSEETIDRDEKLEALGYK